MSRQFPPTIHAEKSTSVPSATSQNTIPPASDKYAHLTPESGAGKWVAIVVGIIAAACVIQAIKRKS